MIKLTQEHLEHAKIPPEYWNVYLKNIPDELSHKKDVKTYLANIQTFLDEGIGLYIWSPENSTGKTAISVLAQKYAMKHGYSTYFITSEDFKDALITKEMFSEDTTIYQRAITVDLLVLDDITKEYRPKTSNANIGFAESKIQQMLRFRSQHRLSTIFTSNTNPKEMGNIYGKDLSEMLRACMKPIHVSGDKNWRRDREQYINRLFKELGE
jgi:DNA replication protein DnaC